MRSLNLSWSSSYTCFEVPRPYLLWFAMCMLNARLCCILNDLEQRLQTNPFFNVRGDRLSDLLGFGCKSSTTSSLAIFVATRFGKPILLLYHFSIPKPVRIAELPQWLSLNCWVNSREISLSPKICLICWEVSKQDLNTLPSSAMYASDLSCI